MKDVIYKIFFFFFFLQLSSLLGNLARDLVSLYVD